MTENKSFIKHPLFIGNTVLQLTNCATSALYAHWITDYSKDGYNLTLVLSSIIGIIVSLAFSIDSVNRIFVKVLHINVRNTYDKFSKFLAIEGLSNLVSIFITAILKTPLGAIIIAILMTPLTKIQTYSVNELTSKIFSTAEKRKDYDNFITTISPFINAAGFAIGFIINHICSGSSAYILLCIAEVVNNVFYYKAYKSIEDAKDTTEVDNVEDIADEADEEEAATDAA